jgi:Spy/CpxP family protein refolding chaperone
MVGSSQRGGRPHTRGPGRRSAWLVAASLLASVPAVAQQEEAPAPPNKADVRKGGVQVGPAESGKPWPPVDEATAAAAAAEARAREEREAEAARERAEMRAQIAALRSEVESERAARAASEQVMGARVDAVSARAAEAPPSVGSARLGLGLTGFVQNDLIIRQSSVDQLNPAGTPLNQDQFQIRRARLRATVDRWWVAGLLEFDGNTVNGAQARIIGAEASLKWPAERGNPVPIVMGTIGLFKIPFGFEVGQSDRERLFIDRSTTERALFPGEYDLGARVMGGWRFLRYAVAVQNGNPIGDRTFPLRDPNAAKDITVRPGVDVPIAPGFWVAGDVSFLWGKGFHAGAAATKATVQWNDLNGNGVMDPGEIVVIPGAAAIASQNFSRFAFGGDLRLGLTLSSLGATVIYGEVYSAKNLDRAILPADPISFGRDYREFGIYGGVTQELGPSGMIGFRYDFYNPDADSTNQVMGAQLPTALSYQTYAIAAALRGPSGRLIAEYDVNRNHNGRDMQGNPANLADNAFFLRGEVSF